MGNEIVSKWVPMAWEAFVDYRLNGLSFSGPELELLERAGVLENFDVGDINNYRGRGSTFFNEKKWELNREGKEFQEKLRRIKKEKS